MTEPYHADNNVTLHHGDCLQHLRDMPDNSVDSIVTDPPYGLSNTGPDKVADTIVRWANGERDHVPEGRGFMGRPWDAFVPPPAVWDECLRVLKPGGHMLVFAGSRTQDLMGLSIRLAGFELRDSLAWIYGSGFPKSLDVSKAIDKGQALTTGRAFEFTEWMRSTGITVKQISEATGTATMGGHYLAISSQPAIATADLFDKLRPLLPEVPERIERLVAERTGIEWTDYVKREVVGVQKGAMAGWDMDGGTKFVDRNITTSHSDAARRWSGWGTALKPSHEPVIVARKPLAGTVAANVLEWGTGALNIDASRVAASDKAKFPAGAVSETESVYGGGGGMYANRPRPADSNPAGRWPANVLLDPEAAEAMDQQSGVSKSPPVGSVANTKGAGSVFPREGRPPSPNGHGDSGGASRFFHVFKYQAKAPKRERPVIEREDGTKVQHPTVKPLALMEWLVTLITPPGGVVLDPFAGSGTTLQAARDKGFRSVGVEADAEHCELIVARLAKDDGGLFAA